MVCRVMPGPWPTPTTTPERADSVRRPGSRPLADLFAVPLAIVLVVALSADVPLLAWGGLLAMMLVLKICFRVALLVRGLVELLKSR